MKEHILKYIELKPKVGYNDLVKIFGLSIDNLLKLLDINNYESYQKYIEFFDNNGNIIYREYPYGNWVKRKYNINDKVIYREHSDGSWHKYEYDNNGELIKSKDSDGNKYNY